MLVFVRRVFWGVFCGRYGNVYVVVAVLYRNIYSGIGVVFIDKNCLYVGKFFLLVAVQHIQSQSVVYVVAHIGVENYVCFSLAKRADKAQGKYGKRLYHSKVIYRLKNVVKYKGLNFFGQIFCRLRKQKKRTKTKKLDMANIFS